MLVSFLKSKGKFGMKRIAVFTLLVALSVACSLPAKAQHMSVASARQSRKADKKQQKATKKYEKAQRKAAKKANHRAKRTS